MGVYIREGLSSFCPVPCASSPSPCSSRDFPGFLAMHLDTFHATPTLRTAAGCRWLPLAAAGQPDVSWLSPDGTRDQDSKTASPVRRRPDDYSYCVRVRRGPKPQPLTPRLHDYSPQRPPPSRHPPTILSPSCQPQPQPPTVSRPPSAVCVRVRLCLFALLDDPRHPTISPTPASLLCCRWPRRSGILCAPL